MPKRDPMSVPAPKTGTPGDHGLSTGLRVAHAAPSFGSYSDQGIIRGFVEPHPGWHRAIVR